MQARTVMGWGCNMAPEPPLLSGDLEQDVAALRSYAAELASYIDSTPDAGWSTVGTATLKVVTSGDTLAHTQDVLASLITVLISRGVLSA